MRYLQLLMLTFLVAAQSAYAENTYVELDAMRAEIQMGGAKFNPYVPKLRVGYYAMNKVALELQYIMSGEDEDSGSNLKIDQMYGGYLRLDSDLHNRVRLYLLAGYTQAELSMTGNLENMDGQKDGGFSWGIGLEDRLVKFTNSFVTLDYMQYYNIDGNKISGISLGLRYLF